MPITRKFLDWTEPALPAIVEDLIGRYHRLGQADLSSITTVFPGRRAGRRFLELLVEKTSGRNTPPKIITIGDLPELLYEPQRPFASDLVQRLAWGEALRGLSSDRTRLVVKQPPEEADFEGWLALGELLSRQHRELAADALDFADVARLGGSLPGFDEQTRWDVLSEIQEKYLALLDHLGLWDKQTARLFAIKFEECRTDQEIVLIGMVDMNRTMRQMLDQVADRVTAYVHAPQRLQHHFDEHGCLDAEAWQKRTLDLRTDQVQVVDGPADQADAVARRLAAFDDRFRPDEITIGVADERLVTPVRRLLTECTVPSRWVVACTLPQTAPYQLLETVAAYLEGERSDRFASLVRHPDVTAWIATRRIEEGWLTELDEYLANSLQRQLGNWIGSAGRRRRLVRVYRSIQKLLTPLCGSARPLGDWTPPLTELLLAIYGRVQLDRNDSNQQILPAACEQIHETLIDHTALPTSLSPPVTAAQAIRLALEQLQSAGIPPDPDEAAVELLGWLELPLDDAPALIVTTFNEGFVPTSVNADLFLPNALRKHLGVTDNLLRYARDAYALSVLLHSRQEVTLIVGRRDVQGEPLTPSRLLFAADPETIARRVLTFFGTPPDRSRLPPLAGTLSAARESSGLFIPRPVRQESPPLEMRVTAFRDYLESPYRFYLKHILKLKMLDDTVDELTASAFGDLAHEVLKRFGRSEIRDSVDSSEIRCFLTAAVDEVADAWYGAERMPAVDIQIVQLRRRLEMFAAWQADWAAQGWRIAFTEAPEQDHPVYLPLADGRRLLLRGRIDRIDRHEGNDAWYIFDYKTGDSGKKPDAYHRDKGRWVDLQLPLYRRLAEPLGVTGDIRLGYMVLPQNMDAVEALEAEWSAAELADAEAVAAEVAGAILDQDFWQELDHPLRWTSDFARICQDGVFGREISV